MSQTDRKMLSWSAGLLALGALCTYSPAGARAQTQPVAPGVNVPSATAVREIEIVVEGRYKPSRVEFVEGDVVRLRFVRKDYGSCTKEVVFSKLNIRRELPTDKPVVIELPALAPGEYEFKCGMNMVKGLIVVKPKPKPR